MEKQRDTEKMDMLDDDGRTRTGIRSHKTPNLFVFLSLFLFLLYLN
jgi:hypothetical protein